jgi:hypothetical protein
MVKSKIQKTPQVSIKQEKISVVKNTKVATVNEDKNEANENRNLLSPAYMGFVSKKKRNTDAPLEHGKSKIVRTDNTTSKPFERNVKTFSVCAAENKIPKEKKLTQPNNSKTTEEKISTKDQTQPSEKLTVKTNRSEEETTVPEKILSTSKHSWLTENSQRWFQFEKIKATLEIYVKDELFHTLKFVSSPILMQYSSESRSLCQVVCTKMSVEPKDKEGFWLMYSNIIEKRLNQKRSDVSNLMKKAFKGKF